MEEAKNKICEKNVIGKTRVFIYIDLVGTGNHSAEII
jgi:hypothetical protein